MKVVQDLTGQRFGRLLVIARAPHLHQRKAWLCCCDCGVERAFGENNLVRGLSASCGCLRIEATTKHGQCRSPEYLTWCSMHNRCSRPGNARYAEYGGRGIAVCERWRDFADFLSDMGSKPGPGHSIERIDNNVGYTPENCRWATATDQQRHKRLQANNKSGAAGVYWNRANQNWCAGIKVSGKSLYLGAFSEKSDAIAARKAAEAYHGFHPDHGEMRA